MGKDILKEKLKMILKNKDNFARAFIENLASYAFAREVGFSDAALIDRLLSKAKSNNYKLRDLICDRSCGFCRTVASCHPLLARV